MITCRLTSFSKVCGVVKMNGKRFINQNVYEASQDRVAWTFDNFEKIYVSFSAGKDSSVMTHLVLEEAKKRNRKVGLFFLDWECQFTITINHAREMFEKYKDNIIPYWVCLPVKTWNGCSSHEPEWTCWEDSKRNLWAREPDEMCITDKEYFPFYYEGIMFEEFVPLFGQWFAEGEKCACFVGIRTQESLNRFRSIVRGDKKVLGDKCYTTKVIDEVWNVYPVYDWQTEDIWTFYAKTGLESNELYDRMHNAGMTIHQMRICEPFGDTQRQSLWLYQVVEPLMWAKLVLRVEGANCGKMYAGEKGNIMGNHSVTLPDGMTWKKFALHLLKTTPPKTSEHYKNKISVYLNWWKVRGYEEGIPDSADLKLENSGKVPAWRKICKTLLRNDYWCKGLGFSPTKTSAYKKYLELHKKKRMLQGGDSFLDKM